MKKSIILSASVLVALAIVGCKKDDVDPNVKITTADVTEITSESAVSGGNVTYDGGKTITAYGVCWSDHENPTIADDKTEDGEGTGEWVSTITGLTPGVTYYVRAYAVNANGVAYGDQKFFSTGAVAPTVTTTAMSEVTFETATTGGTITSDGGEDITAAGVCWGLEENPTLDGSHTTDAIAEDGTFVSHIDGLEADNTYYVRAYATNSKGTSYGQQITFGTSSEPCIEAMKDSNLQAYLIENYDLNNDGKIQVSEAELITFIECGGKGITSIEGLEQLENLIDLRLNDNALTDVNLSVLPKLEVFWGFRNPALVSVNVSGLTNLKYFHCYESAISALDLSACVNLMECNIQFTQMASIDVSACAPLQTLNLEACPIESVDVSNKTSLWYLNVRGNGKTKNLKVNGCSSLQELYFDNTVVESVDASGLSSLRIIWGFELKSTGAQIKADNCPALQYLHAYNSALTVCSAKNCPNMLEYRCFGNPDISEVDFTGSFINDGVIGEINLDGAHLTKCVISKEQKSLSYLNIHQNKLASIDLSDMPSLAYFHCGVADIPQISIANCKALQEAYCMQNPNLKALDFSGCTSLKTIWAFQNPSMEYLDVSSCKSLYYLDANSSAIKNEQKFEDMPDLWFTVLWGTQVPGAVYSNVPALMHMNYENAPLASLSIANAPGLNADADININLVNTKLVTLDVTGAPNLKSLAARDIPTLQSITMTSNPGLVNLWSWNTAQTSVDLRGCADAMGQIFLDANPNMKTIYVRSNQTIADFHYDPTVEIIRN